MIASFEKEKEPVRTILSYSAALALSLLLLSVSSTAQRGNSISGHVFGADRLPIGEVNVELLDDLSRTIQRGRTNASGRYYFYGLPAGRFKVRVLPLGTDYEDQEQDVEIVNFSRGRGSSEDRIVGISREQRDFYLRLRRGASMAALTGAVFVQDVPKRARELFDAAMVDLANKRREKAYSGLKTAIEVFPKYFAALETLGTEYVKAGHFAAAQVLLTFALDVNPRSYRSWHALAVALNAQSKNDEAFRAVERAVGLNPFAPESLLLSGSLLRQMKKFDQAEKRLLKARETAHAAMPEIHWELALLYAHGFMRYKDAAKELKLYLKARPDAQDADKIKKLIAEFEANP
ncbi:MAG: tetratricopeptide repeat protein [Acidobacteriota bacterium]